MANVAVIGRDQLYSVFTGMIDISVSHHRSSIFIEVLQIEIQEDYRIREANRVTEISKITK